jgi:LDH2 family malate/lactate/ureidoglycolate dehydrogenase
MQLRRSNSLGGMLPLGGPGETTGGYKGFGLGLGVELLTALLVGDVAGPFMDRSPGHPESIVSHFFGAIRIDAFRPVSAFKADVDRMIRALRAAPKTPGHDRIYVAGEKEFEILQDRSQAGIPLHSRVIEDLESLAQELGLSSPAAADA